MSSIPSPPNASPGYSGPVERKSAPIATVPQQIPESIYDDLPIDRTCPAFFKVPLAELQTQGSAIVSALKRDGYFVLSMPTTHGTEKEALLQEMKSSGLKYDIQGNYTNVLNAWKKSKDPKAKTRIEMLTKEMEKEGMH